MDREDGKPLKALILCAGFGTRLKPITDVIPKPLVTVYNVPLVDAAIQRCVQAGAKDIAINTHHLSKKMASHVQSRFRDLGARSLFISDEQPEILGTGGALSAVMAWWAGSPLLVYNGDILSNMNLQSLVARHLESEAFVTMAVTKMPPPPGGRSVWVGPDGQIQAIAKLEDLPKGLDRKPLLECGFACAYVADPGLIQYLPKPAKFHDIIESFQAAIRDGKKFESLLHDGFWADVGTHHSLWEANIQVACLGSSDRSKLFGGISAVRLPSENLQAKIDDHSVVSSNAQVGHGSIISSSVILEGGSVEPSECITRTLRGPGLDKHFP